MLGAVVHARARCLCNTWNIVVMDDPPSAKGAPLLHTAAPEQQFIHVMVICQCEFGATCFGTARKNSSGCGCTLKSGIIPLIGAAPVKCHSVVSSHNRLGMSVFVLLFMSISMWRLCQCLRGRASVLKTNPRLFLTLRRITQTTGASL